MPPPEVIERGVHTMAVCNACRYCEQYCPVFPAMERRAVFEATDLALLANLCHNCGECLYACQYAPPHVFAIDVPRMFAEIRLASYEDHCWPPSLARAFRRQGPGVAVLLVLVLAVAMAGGVAWLDPPTAEGQPRGGDFYAVVPHDVMVGTFGAVSLFVLLALSMSLRSYWRTIAGPASRPSMPALLRAIRDGVSLRHLHGVDDCTAREEERTPWRRWAHHLTVGGFLLCAASTSVAALYHALGWPAPYAASSLPVLLGLAGGVGLLVGPLGQWHARRHRDPALADPRQSGMDAVLVALLWLTSATGVLLFSWRERTVMPALLVIHLATVLALFMALPYGKFVHGLYRLAALAKDATEVEHAQRRHPRSRSTA